MPQAQKPNAIELFWWDQPGSSNIGDAISPKVVEYVSGRGVVHAGPRRCDLVAIGSIVDLKVMENAAPKREKPLHVWGSGTLGNLKVTWKDDLRIAAVRGPRTGQTVGANADVTMGDPGLLAARIWGSSGAKPQYSWGIIPHHTQLGKPWVDRLLDATPNSILIDVTDPDIDSTFTKLASCEAIASASLHGLVFADAWAIPSIMLDAGNLHRGGKWKFGDYTEGLGRSPYEPTLVDRLESLDDIDVAALPTNHFSKVSACCDALERAFPEHFRD